MIVQSVLDSILRTKKLRSVQDLQYYEPDNAVIVRKKMGYKNCIIDVSMDINEEALKKHLESTGVIF